MTTDERSYCRWFWQNNKKRLLVYLTVLLTIYVLPIAFTQTDHFQNEMYPMMWAIQLTFVLNLVSAILLPGLLFQPFMKKRSCDLFLPLPIKRNRLFFLQFGFGLFIMVLPDLFFFLSAALESNSWTTIVYDAVALLGCYLFSVCCYAILTFFVVKCNSIVDVVCVSICIPLASILVVATLNDVLTTVVVKVIGQGHASEFFPILEVNDFLNPSLAGQSLLNALEEAYHSSRTNGAVIWDAWFTSPRFTPWLFVYWGVIGGCFFYGGLKSYLKRSGEDSEQKTTSIMVYPLMIFVITTCLIFQNVNDFGLMWFTIVVYFALNFIAERKITVHWKMIASLFVIAILAWGTSSILIETKGFGHIQELTQREHISSVQISFSFSEPVSLDLDVAKYGEQTNQKAHFIGANREIKEEALIDQIYEFQKQCIEKDQQWSENESTSVYVDIYYSLDNGGYSNRHYSFDQESHVEEVKQFIQQLLDEDAVRASNFMDPNEPEG